MIWAEELSYEEHFQHRVMQDALAEAESAYWHRRAAAFESAKPIPGDNHAGVPDERLSAAWRRCDAVARACRNRAELAEMMHRDQVEAERQLDPVDEDAIWRLMWEQGRLAPGSEAVA